MAYSNKKIPNDPTMFPPVQTWMTWVSTYTVTNHGLITLADGTNAYDWTLTPDGEGKLRHHYSLADARKSLAWIARTNRAKYDSPRFQGKVKVDFAVYEWVDGEWVKRFEGFQGQAREDCPLFARGLKYDKKHPIDGAIEQKAIESILRAAQ